MGPPGNDAFGGNGSSQLKSDDVGYFDSTTEGEGPIVTVRRYIFYKNVYAFVNRLKDGVAIKLLEAMKFWNNEETWFFYERKKLLKYLLPDQAIANMASAFEIALSRTEDPPRKRLPHNIEFSFNSQLYKHIRESYNKKIDILIERSIVKSIASYNFSLLILIPAESTFKVIVVLVTISIDKKTSIFVSKS